MREEQLIFLISQPRSGSTLMQKILGAHGDIYTRSEPWVLLPCLTALKSEGFDAQYNIDLQQKAFSSFISGLENGENLLLKSLQEMYLSLYGSYLKQYGKKYFLDKTPRYYSIIKQIEDVFPKAKKIILLRNPLSVLASLIERRKSWNELEINKHDLLVAPKMLIEVFDNKNSNYIKVNYDDLVLNPNETVKKLCTFIGIEFHEKMITEYLYNTERWTFGDDKVYENMGIDATKLDNWKNRLNEPQYWRVMYDYLHILGAEIYKLMGYNYNDSLNIIMNKLPMQVDFLLKQTISLDVLLNGDESVQ